MHILKHKFCNVLHFPRSRDITKILLKKSQNIYKKLLKWLQHDCIHMRILQNGFAYVEVNVSFLLWTANSLLILKINN